MKFIGKKIPKALRDVTVVAKCLCLYTCTNMFVARRKAIEADFTDKIKPAVAT